MELSELPIETLRYNIASGNVYNPEEVKENPINSRIITQRSVRLIATPWFKKNVSAHFFYTPLCEFFLYMVFVYL